MKTPLPNNIFITKPSSLIRSGKRWLLLSSATALLIACSATPEIPSAELQAAERAISQAERAQVIRYTRTELNTAREELTAARSAVTAENMVQAQRLARQAQLSAELALAHADLLKAQKINRDMQNSIQVLEQEVQRNQSGGKP
ncbi:DUF4398 domain-containing protein [Rheinheimera salexigens]|uniref:DUF4398 domain-containing protein n=1 Tax=Rheinheimera salexigens TaxID=1628148 RepID=A0A1E7Q9S3_9GAMM|nr:DUF4398 domain-containing protein [Rheinheimera salexigens]OEY70841.1 hypothetical protein BI198_15715 [Rheinheimera salexigens]